MVALLKELSQIPGVSGDEGGVRKFIKARMESLADSMYIDPMGNLIVFKKGISGRKKLMLCAHMDEVGLIVSRIDDNGMLKFKTVGAIDPRILPSKKVRVGEKKRPGVLGVKAIHLQEREEREKAVKLNQMYVDIGAKNKDDAEKDVSLGDYITFDSEFVSFGENKVKAKALDDRAGCAILMELLNQRYDCDVYACFTVQEEIGSRGSQTVAFHINPDMAIVIEGTTCSDVPGVDKHLHVTRMGRGPAISIADRTSYGDRDLVNALIDTATKKGIPYQIKEGIYGGNDAGTIQQSGEGVATAVVSVPCRYIHSPSTVMDMTDYFDTIHLVREFLKGCDE